MVIFVWSDGHWLWEREFQYRISGRSMAYSRIDLDRLDDYPALTDVQKKAIEEALGE
jgi:hypothetical protein